MTCIIKLLNNTPKSICKLGLKKSGMSIIIKKNIAFRTGHVELFRTGHMKLFRTGHFSTGGKMFIHPKYNLNWI